MADSTESQNVDCVSSPNVSAGDNSQEETSANNRMKRPRSGFVGSSTDNSEDSEPDEKRPAFRLQPPTLIHGQAKSIPKSEEETSSGSSKCKFLQPPRLSAPSSSGGGTSAIRNESVIASQPLVSSTNPFLLLAGKGGDEDVQGGEADPNTNSDINSVTGRSNTEDVKVNGGKSDSSQPDSTADGTKTKDTGSETRQENLFLQAATGSTSLQNRETSGFVFGSKMEDRVAISTETKSPGKDSGDGATRPASDFVFGQNLSERAKVTSSTDSHVSLFAPAASSNDASSSADSSGTLGDDENSQSPSSSGYEKKQAVGLEEDAAAHFRASQARLVMPEVEVVTGEENEKNVLQIQCKLHQFEASTQNWLERGVGSLHLNDGKSADDDLQFQSRLVMRAHGSLRLVLNTKIWAQMTVERASKKSVRITAQTDDGSIGVFLITGTINDAEHIFRALEYRVLHQKQLEERRKAPEANNNSSSPRDSSDSSNHAEEEQLLTNNNENTSSLKETENQPVNSSTANQSHESDDKNISNAGCSNSTAVEHKIENNNECVVSTTTKSFLSNSAEAVSSDTPP